MNDNFMIHCLQLQQERRGLVLPGGGQEAETCVCYLELPAAAVPGARPAEMGQQRHPHGGVSSTQHHVLEIHGRPPQIQRDAQGCSQGQGQARAEAAQVQLQVSARDNGAPQTQRPPDNASGLEAGCVQTSLEQPLGCSIQVQLQVTQGITLAPQPELKAMAHQVQDGMGHGLAGASPGAAPAGAPAGVQRKSAELPQAGLASPQREGGAGPNPPGR